MPYNMVNIRTITIPVMCMIVTGSMAVALDWHFTEPNIALNKNTTQSSTYSDAVSNRAVDGNNNTDYYAGSCSHTSVSRASAWWAVYLAGNYKVSGIIIYNRKDIEVRLKGFKVIGQTASSTSVVFYDDSNASPSRYNDLVIPIQLDDAWLFSSINITIPSVSLTLCEVQIFAACQPPTAIPDGKYSSVHDGYGVGSTITATCDNGYTLYGSNQMTCQRNGSWSTEPKCIDDSCNNPNDLINGKYIFNGVIYESGKRTLGDVITVVCDRGFKQTSGPNQRTCTLHEDLVSNVAWNGTSPTCSLITCSWPVTFTGGHYEAQNKITDENSVPLGTILHAKCENDLFKFTGDENRKCGDNNIWSGAAPSCVSLCNAPNVINGHYNIIGSTLQNQYEQGQRINIICDVGFKLNGNNTERTCGTNYLWNGGDVDCNVTLCNAPNVINGRYEIKGSTLRNQYEQGQQINIICEDGYDLITTNTGRTCGTDHQWKGGDVYCKEFSSGKCSACRRVCCTALVSTPHSQIQAGPIIGAFIGGIVLTVVAIVIASLLRRRYIAVGTMCCLDKVTTRTDEHEYINDLHATGEYEHRIELESVNRDAENVYAETVPANSNEHVYSGLNTGPENKTEILDSKSDYENVNQ